MRTYYLILFSFFSIHTTIGKQIIDNGGFFKNSEIKEIAELTTLIERKTHLDIFIFTTKSFGDKSPLDFGTTIYSKYPTGEKGINNGFLILLSKNEKRMQLMTGYGAEWIFPDSICNLIVNEAIPFFKDGNFSGGIKNVLTQIESYGDKTTWDISVKSMGQIVASDNNKIIKTSYQNDSLKGKFPTINDDGAQFDEKYFIELTSDNLTYKLFFTKYMGELIYNILRSNSSVIYARVVDVSKKELELTGVEKSSNSDK